MITHQFYHMLTLAFFLIVHQDLALHLLDPSLEGVRHLVPIYLVVVLLPPLVAICSSKLVSMLCYCLQNICSHFFCAPLPISFEKLHIILSASNTGSVFGQTASSPSTGAFSSGASGTIGQTGFGSPASFQARPSKSLLILIFMVMHIF